VSGLDNLRGDDHLSGRHLPYGYVRPMGDLRRAGHMRLVRDLFAHAYLRGRHNLQHGDLRGRSDLRRRHNVPGRIYLLRQSDLRPESVMRRPCLMCALDHLCDSNHLRGEQHLLWLSHMRRLGDLRRDGHMRGLEHMQRIHGDLCSEPDMRRHEDVLHDVHVSWFGNVHGFANLSVDLHLQQRNYLSGYGVVRWHLDLSRDIDLCRSDYLYRHRNMYRGRQLPQLDHLRAAADLRRRPLVLGYGNVRRI